jgi:hypothetical protein
MIAPFAAWLVYVSLAAAQDMPKPHVRFFNDSAKAVGFYVDGQIRLLHSGKPRGEQCIL